MKKDAPKKVLFTAVTDSFVTFFLLPYLKEFHERGYEVHVATSENGKIPFCDKKHKISITRSPFRLKNLTGIRELRKIINTEKFDIIHCHTPMGGVVTRLAACSSRKLFGTRVIYTAHGFHFYAGAPFYYWCMFYPVERFLARFTDTIITINYDDYNIASKKFKKCPDIQYIPGVGLDANKINIELTKDSKTQLRKSLGLNDNDFVMIFSARLDKNKNQSLLIEAVSHLIKKYPDIHLLLPGTDELNGKYQRLVESLDLSQNIHFLGLRNDIPQLLQISNVAVSSSRREGLPVNVIESMSAGLPAIVSNSRGNRDLIFNKKGGIIFNDLSDLIDAIKKLHDNPSLCRQYGLFNQQQSQQYLLQNIMDQYRQIYFKKPKVLYLLASDRFSGAENVACTLIDRLKEDFDIAYCSPDGPIRSTLRERGITYVPTNMDYKSVKHTIKQYCPDIIHAHDLKASLLAALCTRQQRLILHIHKNDPRMRHVTPVSLIFRFIQKKANKTIWVSEDALSDYYFKNKYPNKNILIENEIDIDRVIKLSQEYDSDQFDILFLGRLSAQKDPLRFIQIVRRVADANTNIKVAMVGDGELKQEVSNSIKKHRLESNIKMYGFLKNPYPILANSKILCLTSIYEGLPMAVLEAQALGKIIISTSVGGVAKIARQNHRIILSDDDEQMASIILDNLANYKCTKSTINNNSQTMAAKIAVIYEAKNV